MNPVEQLLMESQLLWDSALRKEVAIQRRLYNCLLQAGRCQLKQELDKIHRKLYKNWLSKQA